MNSALVYGLCLNFYTILDAFSISMEEPFNTLASLFLDHLTPNKL